MLAISFAVALVDYLGEPASAQTNSTNATQSAQQPPLTETQRYNNGYKDGLKNSQQDFNTSSCNPTVPTDVEHTAPYKQGYSLGYRKGPCAGKAITSNSSSSSIPGLLSR